MAVLVLGVVKFWVGELECPYVVFTGTFKAWAAEEEHAVSVVTLLECVGDGYGTCIFCLDGFLLAFVGVVVCAFDLYSICAVVVGFDIYITSAKGGHSCGFSLVEVHDP